MSAHRASLRQQIDHLAELHIDADEPSVLDYHTNFESTRATRLEARHFQSLAQTVLQTLRRRELQ